MALVNGVWQFPTGSQSIQPGMTNGQTIFLLNVSTTVTTGPYSWTVNEVNRNVLISADSWGDALVSVQISQDGLKNWMPLLENIGGTPFTGINTNICMPTIIPDCWIRVVLTCTTGVNITVTIG